MTRTELAQTIAELKSEIAELLEIADVEMEHDPDDAAEAYRSVIDASQAEARIERLEEELAYLNSDFSAVCRYD